MNNAKKRKASPEHDSGPARPTTRSRSRLRAEAETDESLTLSFPVPADTENDHQVEDTPTSSDDNDDDGKISNIKENIAKIEENITNVQTEINTIKEEIRDTLNRNGNAKELLSAWQFPQRRDALLSAPKNDLLKTAITKHPPNEQLMQLQAQILKDNEYAANLLKKEMGLVSDAKALALKLKELKQRQLFRNLAGDENYAKSGIIYIEDCCRIELAAEPSNHDIGLLKSENRTLKLRNDINCLDLTRLLKDEWSVTKIDVSKEKFVNELLLKVPLLSASFVRSAWRALLNEYNLKKAPRPGEMYFQQYVCTPYAMLLMAAAGEPSLDGPLYKANENIFSSLSVVRKESMDQPSFQEKMLALMPDAAATLYQQWDAFGMLEIKAGNPCNDRTYLLDNVKCVLITAATALAIKKTINDMRVKGDVKREYFKQIVLPFIVVTGDYASLYVTKLNKKGNPEVYLVKYPSDVKGKRQGRSDTSKKNDISKSPCDARTKLFVAFAVLLNRFKAFVDESAVSDNYKQQLNKCIDLLEGLDQYCPTGRTTGPDSQSAKAKKGKNKDDNSSRKDPPNKTTQEQSAKEAAGYGGMFVDLVNPFQPFFHIDMDDKEQSGPRFYFRGLALSSLIVPTHQDVFLKVWRANDVDIESVESEWLHHNRAFKAGVPVAAPVLSKLGRSTCSRGVEYLVFAVEFIHQDRVETCEHLWQFCRSLIESVLTLHQQAKMLHCDLKPANIRWSNGVIVLIDFEHAQDIGMAAWAPGTDGYQSPEILNNMPCSEMTDAFSVGRIFSKRLDAFGTRKLHPQQQHMMDSLHKVSLKLTDPSPKKRWCLTKALNALQNNLQSDSPTACGAPRSVKISKQHGIVVPLQEQCNV